MFRRRPPRPPVPRPLERGLDRFVARDWRAAAATFEEALERRPDDPVALHGVARSWFELRSEDPGALARAKAAAQRLVELDSDDTAAYATLSQCEVMEGNRQGAEAWGGKARIAGWRDQLRQSRARRDGASVDEDVLG